MLKSIITPPGSASIKRPFLLCNILRPFAPVFLFLFYAGKRRIIASSDSADANRRIVSGNASGDFAAKQRGVISLP